jgi:hypothetical protein
MKGGLIQNEGRGARIGSGAKMSVMYRYGQSRDILNLFIACGSTHPSIGGFGPVRRASRWTHWQ